MALEGRYRLERALGAGGTWPSHRCLAIPGSDPYLLSAPHLTLGLLRYLLTDAVQRLSTALADRYVIERELGA
ncbi:MAG: hypothetical protein Q7J79_00435, partial [Gemmatimonadales bacterium]|nr:hypothetical protein [Gemmatimonadales bacterium]